MAVTLAGMEQASPYNMKQAVMDAQMTNTDQVQQKEVRLGRRDRWSKGGWVANQVTTGARG